MNDLIIVSSNENKIREFKRIMPELKIKKGIDLKEILSNKDEVIVYKVKDLNMDFHIVEDTILETFNTKSNKWEEIVDIKFKLGQLENLSLVRWVTSLGYSDGKYIYVYRGVTEGLLNTKMKLKGFGFDNQFYPKGSDMNYYELDKEGLKDNYSARSKALKNLKNNNLLFKKELDSLRRGKYQE